MGDEIDYLMDGSNSLYEWIVAHKPVLAQSIEDVLSGIKTAESEYDNYLKTDPEILEWVRKNRYKVLKKYEVLMKGSDPGKEELAKVQREEIDELSQERKELEYFIETIRSGVQEILEEGYHSSDSEGEDDSVSSSDEDAVDDWIKDNAPEIEECLKALKDKLKKLDKRMTKLVKASNQSRLSFYRSESRAMERACQVADVHVHRIKRWKETSESKRFL
jgi:hypothetical protein